MNRFFDKKQIAFTLAEMMVIMTLFSVISAATLPVITAKNNMDMSEDSTASGYFPDPWNESQNGTLSYYNAGTPFADKSAVIVGGKISGDAYALGYPELIVRNNNFAVPDRSSQIILSKQNSNGSPYMGGRIMMSAPDASGSPHSGSIALGSYALIGNARNTIAVGAYAGSISKANNNLTHMTSDSIYIGQYDTGLSINSVPTDNSISIGYNAGYVSNSISVSRSVAIGSYSQHAPLSLVLSGDTKSVIRSVAIGAYSGYGYANHNNEVIRSVNIGYYSGMNVPYFRRGVAIGYYSNAQPLEHKFSSEQDVIIGTYAGAYSFTNASYDSSSLGRVAIGYEAGYGMSGKYTGDSSVSVGYGALTWYDNYDTGDARKMAVVALGTGAAYAIHDGEGDESNIVSIGYYAFSNPNICISGSNVGHVAIGTYTFYDTKTSYIPSGSSVAIGPYAGYSSQFAHFNTVLIGNYAGAYTRGKSLSKSVCIGDQVCYASSGSNDVRIAPKSQTKWTAPGGSQINELQKWHSYIGHSNYVNETAADSTYTGRLFNPDFSNLFISPLAEAYESADWAYSSIILYADHVYGPTGGIVSFSDKNLKENIKPLKYGLKDLRKINIYEYKMKDDSKNTPRIGVIAQELQEIIPEAVRKFPEGFLAINPEWITFTMFNAIQELDKYAINAQNEFKSYVKEYASLASRVKALEKEVKILEKENKSLSNDIDIAYRKAKKLELKGQQ